MKKITKFLDSVMGGIKRTCVAKALAVFAVASVTTSSFAQTLGEANPVINGVEDFKGLTLDKVKEASTSTNFSFADKAKVLFLYNVGTGKFLNVGGYWGTCAGLHDYGKALWVDYDGSKFKFTVNNNNDTGNTLGLLLGDSETDHGVFVDRGTAYNESALTNWSIVAVGDAKNTVKIYTTKNSGSGNEKPDVLGDYYLSANPDYDGTNKVCDAYKDGKKDGKELGENSEWRIFTYDQIYTAQQGSVDNMKNALDLSFRLKSPNFERHDGDIKYWKTYDFVSEDQNEDGFAKFGLEKYYIISRDWTNVQNIWADVKNDLTADYTFNNGKVNQNFADVNDYQRYLGKYFCGSITGKCGILYQDIDITLHGTYIIECKGYSNTTKAKLFAGVLDPNNENKMVDGTMNSTVFNQVSNMSAEEQNALHTGKANMDYAGKAFFDNRKYMNSVVLTVPESAFIKNGVRLKSVNIRLGVMTGDYNSVEAPASDEWTVFDDFRLQYASTNPDQDLILDEMRDNLNYLVNGSDKYENTTLHLKKKLTKNKWNSLVLPVSLTKDQLQSAFGANTRLAELNTLTPTSIEFKSVGLDKIGDTDVALVANKPYIIFPEKDQTESNSASYTAIINVNNKTKKVNVSADHYIIAKVTNVDLSNINTKDWTTKLYGGDGTITAYGTFARTFGSEQKEDDDKGTYTWENDGSIISGRPRLEHSYFFDKGNMYHSTGRPRGLRGFSCWFEPTTTSGAQNAQLTIDGVSQGTTGIEDILADYEQPVSRFANGIYNLNGQLVKQGNSTAGLPSGMYIVNGKKCIVR